MTGLKIVLEKWDRGAEDIERNNLNLTIYSKAEYHKLVRDHDIMTLMSIFLPNERKVLEKVDFAKSFSLDLRKLKRSVVKESLFTWSKAKVLWNNERDYKKSKKNLVHSIRYLMFGLQIAQFGTITDFYAANAISDEIINKFQGSSFEEYERRFLPVHDELFTRLDKQIEYVIDLTADSESILTKKFPKLYHII